MKVLIEEEISYVLGGRWITLPDGTRIWIEEDDEEEEGDEIIFVQFHFKEYNRTGNIIARRNWDKAHTLPEALKTGNLKILTI